MFMTNYELVYGKRKFSSDASNTSVPAEYHSTPVIQSEESVIAESSKAGFMQSAVGFMKSDDTKQRLGSLAGKLKNAAGVAAGATSGLAKSAVETAKSEETATKLASLKEKAQSAAGGISASVSGLGNKASEAIASRKHSARDEIAFSETDMTHTEEYLENTVQEEPVYTDDFSETSSQENYAPNEEYEADEYIEEYENASIETEEEIPVYNEAPKETYHSQTVYTKTHDNTYSNIYDQTTTATTQEKSNKKPVIIGIAAGLGVCAVFAGGLFGGMYLMKNKNDTPNNDNVIAESTTEASTTEKPTEKVTEEVKTEALTEEKTGPQTTVTLLPYEEYEEAAMSALDEFMDSYFGDIVSYGLVDVSGEGVPELIIDYETEAASASSIYIFNGSDYGEPIRLGEGAEICFSEHLIEAYGYGEAVVRYVYGIDNYGELILKDEIREEYTGYNWVYTLNGRNITNTDYDEINRVYDSMEWEYVCVNEYKRKNTESQNSQTSFSSDINYYPLYLERLQWIATLINQRSEWSVFVNNDLSISYSSVDPSEALSVFGYILQDMNNDGVAELIIGQQNDSDIIEMYTIDNNQLITLCQTQERIYCTLCENNIISISGSMGASGGGTSFNTYNGGNKLEEIANVGYEYPETGEPLFYLNGNQVSENEVDNITNSYKTITLNVTPLSSISSSGNNTSQKEYTVEEILNNAGSDFYFYEHAYSERVVATDSGSLNLRAAPTTEADIITKIPKGTYVAEVGYNNEWSLIIYLCEDGSEYVGYVSSQYLQ